PSSPPRYSTHPPHDHPSSAAATMRRRTSAVALLLLAAVAVVSGRSAASPTVETVPPVAGEAVIYPVESNLAPKPWVRATASSGASSAAAAVDDDPETAWIPAEGAGEWLAVDLGGGYRNLRKVEILFTGPGAGRY